MKKQKTVIFDSSVWVSYMLQNDVNHLRAKDIMANYLVEFDLLIPDIVFYEVITVLLKLKKINLVVKFCVKNIKILYLNKFEFLFYAFKYKEMINLKTQDFLIIVFCLLYSVDVFETLDKKQYKNYLILKNYGENR